MNRSRDAKKLAQLAAYVRERIARSNKKLHTVPIEAAKQKADKRTYAYPKGKSNKTGVPKGKTLTLRQLLKHCLPDRKRNAERDQVTIVKFERSKINTNKIRSETLTYLNSLGTGRKKIRRHKHIVVRLEPGKKFSDSKIIWACDCEDHTYRWEYALMKRGNSVIKFSNGEYPIDRNPRLYPGLCKHGYRVLTYIIAKGL